MYVKIDPEDYIMANSANLILDQALELSATERASVAERLLFSLDSPDSKIDALWAKEADSRIEAYNKGKIEAVPAEEVFAKYRRT
jgi:putative addiction module component (TIGR02574 family)